MESTLEISQEDLSKVRKTAAFLEEDTKDGGHSGTDDPFSRPQRGGIEPSSASNPFSR